MIQIEEQEMTEFLDTDPLLELSEDIEDPLVENDKTSNTSPEPEVRETRDETPPPSPQSPEPIKEELFQAERIVFPELEERVSGQSFDLDFFANIPVKVDIFLGQTTISLKEIYDLSEGSIIDLDKQFGEPLELKINGQIIAYGDVVSIDKNYGIMIRDIVRNKK